MRQVGSRRERPLSYQASSQLLIEGARFSEAVSHLAQTTFIPKGVYRFHSHEDANQHQERCLVLGMAGRAAHRT
jgi:phage FluMu gp28-like protein